MLLKDLHVEIKLPKIIHCDNARSTKIAKNLGVNPKTRHFAIHYHFIRKNIKFEKINLKYILILEKVDDIFTKPLEYSLFEKFKERLSIINIYSVIK